MGGLYKMSAVFSKDAADMAAMETIVTENQVFFQEDTILEAIKRNAMEMEDGATVYIQDLVIVADKDTGKIIEIPSLTYSTSSKKFTLKRCEKRQSTLNSLAPKKNREMKPTDVDVEANVNETTAA